MPRDVIVIGARCGGSSLARLLASEGVDVLIVDKASPNSEVISTNCITLPGIQILERWNLLKPVLAMGTPLVKNFKFHVNSQEVKEFFGSGEGAWTIAPRRNKLDDLLFKKAIDSGAKALLHHTLDKLVIEDDRVIGIVVRDSNGRSFQVLAEAVIGADGRGSKVAKLAGAKVLWRRESPIGGWYAYFSGLPLASAAWYFKDSFSAGLFPTDDNLVCVWAMTDVYQSQVRSREIDNTALLKHALESADAALAQQIEAGTLESRVRSFGAHPGVLRQRFGRGWALVGDAGYYRHPITAHGITDAFRDAALLAEEMSAYFQGSISWNQALTQYEDRQLSVVTSLFEATQTLAIGRWLDGEPIKAMESYKSAVRNEIKREAEWWGRCNLGDVI